jgi:hypothetical protein
MESVVHEATSEEEEDSSQDSSLNDRISKSKRKTGAEKKMDRKA